MAIEVGALSLAIETNAASVTNELKQLDRELKRVAADQATLSSQAKAASKLETQVKREMLAAQKELNRLSKASKTSDADIQARAAAQARLNQLTKDYAEAQRLAAAAETASLANRQRRDALRAEVADTKQAVKEMESERKASDARLRAHQAGLGKAHVATIRAETKAETEERRRQSALQRDIDKRIGVDRQRMDRVMYAQRQTMYNELFAAEAATIKQAELERKAAASRARAHDAGLARAHIADRQRQSAMQRDIDKRVGADQQRLNSVIYAQRQAMYNELFVAETSSTRKAERERVRAAKQADQQIAASRRAATRIALIESQRAAQQAAARQKLIMGTASPSSKGGLAMFGLSGTFAATMAATGLVRAANDAQLLQQRLAQVVETGAESKAIFDQLFESAQRLRTPVTDVTELFVKLRQSNDALGYSYDETLQVTEAFSAALRISGASGQTAASALLQFGQAMAKGRLDGDEFRTVAENASEVLRSLERAFGVSRGEILKWREEGKLTSKMIADVLIRDKQALVDKAAQLAPTMRQAATQFRNSIVEMVTNSKTLEEAFNGIALSISKVSTTITGSKEELGLLMKVLGYGAAAATLGKGLGLVASNLGRIGTALGVIVGYATKYPKLFAGGLVGGTVLLGEVVDSAAQARALDRQSKLVRDAVRQNSAYAVILERVRKAQSELTLSALNYNATMETGDTRAIKAAKNRVTAAFDALAAERRVLDSIDKQRSLLSKGAKEVIITAEDTAAGKASKDTTDQFLSAMKALAEEGVDVSRGMERLYAIMASAQSVVDNQKSGIIELAEAKERLARANELLLVIEGFGSEDMQEASAQIRDMNQFLARHIELLNEMGRVGPEQITQLRDALTEARAALAAIDPEGDMEGFEEQADVVQRLANAWEFLTKKYGQFLQAGEKATNKPFQEQISSLERYYRNVERQIVTTLLDAPSDLVTSYFDALGQSVVDGGVNVGEKMRQAFASIFSNIGSNLIRDGFARLSKELLSRYGKMMLDMGASTTVFGKFLTAIKAAISNPLIAGPALIAVGAAMVAYSAKMGAIGRGSSGGDFGGGLGGLNVGRDPAPIIYRLGDRPMQSRVMNGDPSQSGQSVVVNATIIGPNDPRAQRDIATLVDNAARRGLLQGAGVRT